MSKITNNSKIICILLIVVGLLIASNLIVVPCLFHEVTGLFCPGCGMTRAVKCLLRLDIIGAIKYNLLVVILIPFFGYYGIRVIVKATKNEKIPSISQVYSKKVVVPLLIITILFGIIRNFSIFSFLQP